MIDVWTYDRYSYSYRYLENVYHIYVGAYKGYCEMSLYNTSIHKYDCWIAEQQQIWMVIILIVIIFWGLNECNI